MWHVTGEMGRVVHDTWCGVNIISNCHISRSNGLRVMMSQRFGGNDHWLNKLMNNKAVCRTATPGLLKNIYHLLFLFKFILYGILQSRLFVLDVLDKKFFFLYMESLLLCKENIFPSKNCFKDLFSKRGVCKAMDLSWIGSVITGLSFLVYILYYQQALIWNIFSVLHFLFLDSSHSARPAWHVLGHISVWMKTEYGIVTIQTFTFLWHETLLIWSWGPFTTEGFHEISKDIICIVRFEIRGYIRIYRMVSLW